MQFVLVHSPLVGPSSWRDVARALEAAGHDVTVPDLRGAAVTGRPEAVIDAATAAIPHDGSPVVVGHSGAGPLLPAVADGRADTLVFVDAGLPPGGDFLDPLRALAVDGLLPKWSTWWGDGVMERLVPDADRRAELEAEMPEVPLAFFEAPVAVPGGWWETPGAYLLLSEPYRDDAERARAMGWPVVERLGGHLDLVNDADGVAETILRLVG